LEIHSTCSLLSNAPTNSNHSPPSLRLVRYTTLPTPSRDWLQRIANGLIVTHSKIWAGIPFPCLTVDLRYESSNSYGQEGYRTPRTKLFTFRSVSFVLMSLPWRGDGHQTSLFNVSVLETECKVAVGWGVSRFSDAFSSRSTQSR